MSHPNGLPRDLDHDRRGREQRHEADHREGLTSATYIHEADETVQYERGFAQVWALAADEEESATILRRRIDQC